jgi:hypothetical protein
MAWLPDRFYPFLQTANIVIDGLKLLDTAYFSFLVCGF